MNKPPRSLGPRSGLAMLLMAAVAVAVFLFVNMRRGRPASEAFRGRFDRVVLPSAALEAQVPKFITAEYGATKFIRGGAVLGFTAGNADKGNFVAIALSRADAQPFEGGGFADWLGEAYLECLATADSAKGRNWWALETNIQLPSKPYLLTYAVARNTIPMVSRSCVVGTNGLSDINVRIYGHFSGNNISRFAEDLKAMFRSLVINEARTRELLGLVSQ